MAAIETVMTKVAKAAARSGRATGFNRNGKNQLVGGQQ